MTAHLRVIEPRDVNRSVPVRPANAELRPREYLTPTEVEKLTKAARGGRYGHRDATLILIAYRHGLRAAEICDLEWSQVEFGPIGVAACPACEERQAAASIRSAAMRSGHCASYAGSSRTAPSCSPPSAAARSPPMRSTASSSASAHAPAALSGPRPHAPPRLRLRPGQRRPRHARPPGLARPPQHSAHRPLHGAVADAVQGFLAQLIFAKALTRSAVPGDGTRARSKTVGAVCDPSIFAAWSNFPRGVGAAQRRRARRSRRAWLRSDILARRNGSAGDFQRSRAVNSDQSLQEDIL